MREILFRGKRKDSGDWMYGTVVYPRSIKSKSYTAIVPITDGESVYSMIREVIPETVGQFTGATDKNGKKIFEGDIARFDKGFFVVRYSDCRMGFCFDGLFGRGCQPGFTTPHWEYVEIIGNIHDNPELLEVSK